LARLTKSFKGVWFILKTLPVFILRQTPYRNADVILTGLSPEGYLTIQARGALKMTSPFQAMVSLGAWSELTINQSKQKAYLEKANLISFAPLPDREGLLASLAMQTILQVLLIDEEIDNAPALYQRLVEVRKHMDNALSSYIQFLVLYLEDQGVPIIVDYCVNCQNKLKIVGMNTQLGGFICQPCFEKVSGALLSANALKLMRTIKHQSFQGSLDQSLVKMLLPLVHEHFNFHLDIRLAGFKTIETFLQ